MSITDDPTRLAKLLASLNVSGPNRPLGPVETAVEIENFLSHLKNDKTKLCRRLPIKIDMVNAFLRLAKLPLQIQDAIVWGEAKPGSGQISFTAAQLLARLNPDDARKVAQAAFDSDKPLTREEASNIVSCYNKHAGRNLDECIREVFNVMRPLVVEYYLFISGMDPETARLLFDTGRDASRSANEILSKKFPADSIKSVRVSKSTIKIMLTKDGNEFLRQYSGAKKIPRKDAINKIIAEAL